MKAEKRSSHERILFIVVVGVMSAISVVLAYLIHLPLIPGAPFLEYDPADIVIYACTYLLGVPCGLLMTVVVSIVQGITVSSSSGIIGILMHIVATGSFVLVSGGLFGNKKIKNETGRLVVATVAGIIVATVVMVLWNLLLTPIFMKQSRELIITMLPTVFVPFNLIKAGINGIGAAILYYPVKGTLKIKR